MNRQRQAGSREPRLEKLPAREMCRMANYWQSQSAYLLSKNCTISYAMSPIDWPLEVTAFRPNTPSKSCKIEQKLIEDVFLKRLIP